MIVKQQKIHMILREKNNIIFKIQFLLLLALMQSEFRVIEPCVFPFHKTSASLNSEIKVYGYTCFSE